LAHDIPQYIFKALDGPDKIRILKLHATTGDLLECSIQQINISEGGYQALSYVWGSEERKFRTIVRNDDGKALGYIPLTTNLNKALRDLRDAKELKNKFFWIDQICIDQAGKEKNHQVQLMSQIFANAQRVITYLGSAAADDVEEQGINLLDRLDNHFSANYDILIESGSLINAFGRLSEFPVIKLSEDLQHQGQGSLEEAWKWLVEVAFGEWTTRLWMAQEQLINTDIVMLRGPRLLSWERVAIVSSFYFLQILPREHIASFWIKEHGENGVSPWSIAESVYSLWYERKTITMSMISYKATRLLVENIFWYHDLRCRDQRDRIFALLAISADAIDLGIAPDYSENNSVSKVFLDFSVRILQKAVNLDLIRYACWSDNLSDPTRPSWGLNPPRAAELQAATTRDGCYRPHPLSSLSTRPQFHLDSNNSVLILKGRILDHISMSTQPMFYDRSYRLQIRNKSFIRPVVRWISSCSEVLVNLDMTLAKVAALCTINTLDPTWSPTNSMEETAFSLWCLFRTRVNELRQYPRSVEHGVSDVMALADSLSVKLATMFQNGRTLDSFSPSDNLSQEEAMAASELDRHTRYRGRSFCITEQNRLCSGANEVRKGDAIAAFEGTDRLYILRPVGERYRLIGEAYVDGLMQGEAYEGVDPNEVDYTIELV
jgi:heterokaryon incompatibility protein (HET)